MSTFSYDFSAQSTANPWTVPSPLLKLSTTNFAITNASGVRSASNGNIPWGAHNVAYTGGATEILATVTFPSLVFNGDLAGPGIFARSGTNQAKGYHCYPDNAGNMYLVKVDATGGQTQIASVGSITLSASDTISIGYVQSTNTVTGYQNGVSKLTATDSTYNADTTLAAGWMVVPGNLNAQYIKTFASNGVASSSSIYTKSKGMGGGFSAMNGGFNS